MLSTQAGANAGLSASPASLNFGSLPANTLSAPQAITLFNVGNQSITILQVASSVPQFAVSGPALPATVAPGQGASFLVVFGPNGAGAFSGSINFSLNRTSGGVKMIPVSGTGVGAAPTTVPTTSTSTTTTPTTTLAPAISLSSASLALGSVLVGSSLSQSVVLTNTGTADLSISQISASGTGFSAGGLALPATVPAGQSAAFTVSFSPVATGSAAGSVTILSNAANAPSATIALSGTGTAQTLLLSASAASLNFGSVLVGTTSASSGVTFTNTGNTPVSISQVSVTGSGFTAAGIPAPSTLAPGQAATLMVSFAPSVIGAATGSVSLVSNATNSPATVSVSGAGVQPQLSVQPTIAAFGNVPVGSTYTQTVTLTNSGTATLTISQSSISGSGFSTTGLALPLSLAPGASTSFTLAYAPAAAGTVSGTLSLSSNAPISPTNVALSGTGLTQTYQLSANPTSLNFASTTVGTSSTGQTVTLSNTGNSTVTISQLSLSGTSFSATGLALPLNLAAGQSTSFSVIFAPLTTGTLAGSVTVVSTASNSPMTIALSGSAAQTVFHSVSLTWSDTSTTLAGFNVYRGATTGGPYTKINASLAASTSFIDTAVQSGSTYYYVTTAVDTTGTESSYSNESAAIIP